MVVSMSVADVTEKQENMGDRLTKNNFMVLQCS